MELLDTTLIVIKFTLKDLLRNNYSLQNAKNYSLLAVVLNYIITVIIARNTLHNRTFKKILNYLCT